MEIESEFPDQPRGNVHEYPVAPETAAIEYVCVEPWQTEVSPEIFPGCMGRMVSIATIKVCAALLPQGLFAITDIVPPEFPAVAHINDDVELPDHPGGKTQV